MFLLLATGGLCSYPKVDYDVNIDNTLLAGNFTLGDITFSKDGFYSEVYYLSPNLSDIELERYDIISTANLNFSVLIDGYSYSPNSELKINELKTYNVSSTVNSSNTCNIFVSNPDNNEISLSSNLDFIHFSDDDFYFFYDIDEMKIDVSSAIPTDQPAGDYDWELEIQNKNTTITYKDTLTILPNHEWDVVKFEDKTNKSSNGGFGDYALLVVENLGNELFNLNIDIQGNISKIIKMPQTLRLYPGTNSSLDIRFSVPFDLDTGLYTGELEMSSDDETQKYNLSFMITDLTDPELRQLPNINYTAGVETKFEVETFDNLGVENVTLQIKDSNGNIIIDEVLDKKSEFVFSKPFTINKTGDFDFKVCITDVSGNEICNTTTETFIPLDRVVYKDHIDMGSVKDKKYVGDTLLTISPEYNMPFNITISKLDYDGNCSIKFTTSKGKDYFIDTEKNQSSVSFEEESKIDMFFKGDSLGEFSVILNIETLDFHVPLDTINLKGKVVDYDLPDSQTYNNWFASEDLICGVMEGSNIESSKWDCQIKYPISMNFEELPIPFTVEAKEQIETKYQKRIDKLESKNAWLNIIMIIVISSLSVVFLALLYMTIVFPKTRIRYGG
jgi:hypothetical protein